jgi:hypothetical protein
VTGVAFPAASRTEDGIRLCSTVHEMALYGAWLLLRIVHGDVRSPQCVNKIVSLLKKSLPLTFTTNVIRYTLQMYELRSESSRMASTVKVRRQHGFAFNQARKCEPGALVFAAGRLSSEPVKVGLSGNS